MRILKLVLSLLLLHAVAYFGALAAFGYSPERAFLLSYIVG